MSAGSCDCPGPCQHTPPNRADWEAIADRLARHVSDAIRSVTAYRKPVTGMGANISMEDRGRFSLIGAESALEAYRVLALQPPSQPTGEPMLLPEFLKLPQPPGEGERKGQGQSTYDLYAARERAAACAAFNPCPLGESGDPLHNFTCALLCQDCGMNEQAHSAPPPPPSEPGEPTGDPCPRCGRLLKSTWQVCPYCFDGAAADAAFAPRTESGEDKIGLARAWLLRQGLLSGPDGEVFTLVSSLADLLAASSREAEPQESALKKAAKKYVKWRREYGSDHHVLICNWRGDDVRNTYCNCGWIDLLRALSPAQDEPAEGDR